MIALSAGCSDGDSGAESTSAVSPTGVIPSGDTTSSQDVGSSTRGGEDGERSDEVSNEHSADAKDQPLVGAIRVEVLRNRACALLEDGHVWCWGKEHDDAVPSFRARQVPGLEGVTDLSVEDEAACAVISNGGLACWGHDSTVDFITDAPPLPTPTVVEGVNDAVLVRVNPGAASGFKACVVDRNHTLSCWPYKGALPRERVICAHDVKAVPTYGRALTHLGTALLFGGLVLTCTVYDVPELEGADTLSRGTGSGGEGVCGIVDGQVLCADLVDSRREKIVEVDQQIALPGKAIALDTSNDARRCALLEGGELWCWGGLIPRWEGMDAPRLELSGDIVDFGVQDEGGCAVLRDTTVMCWGQNGYGQRGSDAATKDPPSLVLR